VAMILSALSDASAVIEGDNDDVEDDARHDHDSMSDIGQWVRDFVKLERRVVEEEAERLESMVEKIEERQSKGGDLLDRIASDSVVKTYLDKVDIRIGELMSKFSRKPDIDQEEIRQARAVQPDDDGGNVSLKKSPLETDDLLHRLDSLFRNVLTKQFGRKLAKAFFKHIFPLVAEELQKEEERRMKWEKKKNKKVIEDRRDSFSEFVARPATSAGGAEFRARPSFASSGAEFSARASSAQRGAEFRARSKYEQYGGVTEGADTLEDWVDLLRKFLF